MSERRPNILWVCTDQQRFDTIGALGNPQAHTPNLDRLVSNGVAFSRAYCQSPICTPSRASFMTGRYPATVHVNYNGNDFFPREAEATLVSRMLAEAGYDCGLVGKFHLAGCAERKEPRLNDGFRYFQWSHSPRFRWAPEDHDYARWLIQKGEDPARVLKLKHQRKDRILEPTPDDDNVPPELHHTTWHGEKALDFLRGARAPWLLCLNTFEPHPPFNPPWEYYRRFDPRGMPGAHFREKDIAFQDRLARAGVDFQTRACHPDEIGARAVQAAYYAMIEMIDHQVGRILEFLDSTDIRKDTVVLFMSDHGEMLGDHGLVQKGCRFYEGLVRVPLIWEWGKQFRPGAKSEALVELTDVAPTLLQLAGLPVPSLMQGRSLLPILRGGITVDSHRSFVRSEYLGAEKSSNNTYGTMYFDGRHKLTLYHSADTGELYDVERDPWEFNDLWDDASSRDVRHELIRRSFNASMMAEDAGPARTMEY